jgi:hypothetical protein
LLGEHLHPKFRECGGAPTIHICQVQQGGGKAVPASLAVVEAMLGGNIVPIQVLLVLLTLLLHTDPIYKGIKAPDDSRIKHAGYADDTVIGVADDEDIEPLERILRTFEIASGNEIKPTKSYILWLGPRQNDITEIYNIKPLPPGRAERYLGVYISHDFSPKDNWKKVLDKLPSNPQYWATKNYTIFGRTLLLNTCMLSKVWYLAHHSRANKEVIKAIDTHTDNYFRKGRRSNSVSKNKRLTPKKHGGLGQLNPVTQIRNLLAKWVIKYTSGDTHPWTIYWKQNVIRMQDKIGVMVDPAQWRPKGSWNKFLDDPKIFDITAAAYEAWDKIDLEYNIDSYDAAAMQPILFNRLITPNRTPIFPTQQMNRIISNMTIDEHQMLRVAYIFREVVPTPIRDYNHDNRDTWRHVPKTPAELNAYFNVQAPDEIWQNLIDNIPTKLIKLIAEDKRYLNNATMQFGWGATIVDPDGDDRNQNPDPSFADIGDIYHIEGREGGNPLILWYKLNPNSNELTYQSNQVNRNNDDWNGWQAIPASLKSIQVSCTSGKLRLLGWTDKTLGLEGYRVPGSKGKHSIERAIVPAIMKMSDINNNNNKTYIPRPKFNKLFQAIRHEPYSDLPQLQQWTPTQEEEDAHSQTDRGRQGIECTINWPDRMKKLESCPYLKPKYRQLLYWITTSSLMVGTRLIRIPRISHKGMCPHCAGVVATPTHIFAGCSKTQEVWNIVDAAGLAQWGPAKYKQFEYNDIPTLTKEYDPSRLLKISTLWAIWTHWCKWMWGNDFTPDHLTYWTHYIMKGVKEEFSRRVYEMKPMIQWVKIIKDRRTKRRDERGADPIPEKEFLLTKATQVNTNPQLEDEPENNPQVQDWIGNQYLLEQVMIDNRPKLRIKHATWQTILLPLGARPPDPPAPDWCPMQPAYVAP